MRPPFALGWSVLAVLLAAGCGNSVEPRAPYDDPARIPPPRNARAELMLSGAIRVVWEATAADRQVVDGWHVERRASTETAFTRLTIALTSTAEWFDLDVTDNARFVYRVIAATGAGVAGVPVESAMIRADLALPTAPSAVLVTPRSTALEVAFTPGPDPDLAAFQLRLVASGGGEPQRFMTVFASPTTVDGLTPGRAYAVTVAAIDSAGRFSIESAPPVSATPLP